MRRIYNQFLSLFKRDKFPFEIEDVRAEISKKDTSGHIVKSQANINPYLIRIHLNIEELGQQYRRYMIFYAKQEVLKKKSEYIHVHRNGWKQVNWDKLSMYVRDKLSH